MELGLVLREPLVLAKVHSFATQTEVFDRLEMVGGYGRGQRGSGGIICVVVIVTVVVDLLVRVRSPVESKDEVRMRL
jgi:hypothetical protein